MHHRSLVFVCLVVVAIAASSASAWAQDRPARVELFGGYSLLPANGDDFPRGTSHGVQGSVTFNLTRAVGLVGEAGVQFSRNSDLGPSFAGQVAETRVTELLGGPRFTARGRRADVFAHGWFGLANGNAGPSFQGFSDSAIALGGGGGVDVHLTPRLAIRAQFDYLGSFADIVETNTRLAVGAVIRLRR